MEGIGGHTALVIIVVRTVSHTLASTILSEGHHSTHTWSCGIVRIESSRQDRHHGHLKEENKGMEERLRHGNVS